MAGGDARARRRPAARPTGRTSSPTTTRRTTARSQVAEGPAATRKGTDSVAGARRASARPHLTGRAAILLIVVAALAVTLAWPARALIDQRREVAALRAENQATLQRISDTQAALDRWQDRAYVESQARARLHFVRPGETAYVVVGPGEQAPQVAPAPAEVAKAPWFATLWKSVEGAAADAG